MKMENKMFSDNRKISGRQIKRLLFFDLAGLSTLLLPPLLAQTAGKNGIFCIFLALLPAYGVVLLIQRTSSRMVAGFPDYIRQTKGKFTEKVILILCGASGIVLAGFVLDTVSRLITTQLLKGESYWLVSFLILILGAYGMAGGMEGRARIYEVLFWPLLIPLVLMLVLACRDVNADYWTPVFFGSGKDVALGTLLAFLFYLPVCFLLFLVPYEKNYMQGIAVAKRTLFFTALLNAAIYLITLGIFGEASLREMKRPVITLMSMIRLPGGFFERQDAFMVAIWFFALYALLNSSMFYGTESIKSLIGKKGNKRYVLLIFFLTFLVSAAFYKGGVMEW